MKRLDKSAWLVAASMALSLASATIMVPRGMAQTPAHAAPVPRTPAPSVMDDGDGDELLEHWGDSKYAREERVQIGGILVLLGCVGAAAWRRRSGLRRLHGTH